MPSFLSKVFGRKKPDDKESSGGLRASNGSLLEGKFEAISPTVSPTADKFAELPNVGGEKEKEKEKAADNKAATGFSLLRAKSGSVAQPIRTDAPHLSLNLPGPKDDTTSRNLRSVFEADPDEKILLTESVIGERRLNPLETLILVRACSQAITAHGLETLGIMHPHWYSASPDTQRRLISLFIQSLAPKSPITTLAPSPSSAVSAFESEISSTRSPHDVAAVLRWGLRHLQLEGTSFGKDSSGKWYQTFLEAERASEYAPNAFSDKLVPQLPAAHLELLTATLNLFSSLAAHAEANGISGSKLSKLLGLWLLTATRAEPTDTWSSFYSRWETAGRQLEHLFLSLIRDENTKQRLPKRLTELVHYYPYAKGPRLTEEPLLPRPRFSTRQYTALFIGLETELSSSGTKPSYHPLKLISDAFKSSAPSPAVTPAVETDKPIEGEDAQPLEPAVKPTTDAELWEKVKKAASSADDASSPSGYPGLSRIFADETIRFLSLVPIENSSKEPVPSFKLFEGTVHRRSFSLGDTNQSGGTSGRSTPVGGASTSGHANGTANGKPSGSAAPKIPASVSSHPDSSNSIGLDWAQFSTSGFIENLPIGTPLAATLLDKDVEVTAPGRKGSKKGSVSRGRKSLDILPPISTSGGSKKAASKAKAAEVVGEEKLESRSVTVSLTQLDEAFVDFWSDALLDPISKEWPQFIICKLKSGLQGLEVPIAGEAGELGGVKKKVEWLIIEQKFVPKRKVEPVAASSSKAVAPSPTTTEKEKEKEGRRPRPSSPKPSFKSDISATLGATRKRFTFFGSSSKDKASSPTSEVSHDSSLASATTTKAKKNSKNGKSVKVGEMGEILKEEDEKAESPKPKDVKETSPAEDKKEKSDVKTDAGDPVSPAAIAAGAGAVVASVAASEVLANEAAEATPEQAAEATAAPTETVVPEFESAAPEATPAVEEEATEVPAAAEVPHTLLADIPEPVSLPEVQATPVIPPPNEPVPEPTPVVVEPPVVEEAAPPVEPEPVAEPAPAEPEPQPVVEEQHVPEPEPVRIATPEPEPVVEEAVVPEPEPVRIATPEPEPVVEEVAPPRVPTPVPEPEPVVEEPVVHRAPTPEPEPVVEEPIVHRVPTPEPEPLVEEPIVHRAPTPEPEPVVEERVVHERVPTPVPEPVAAEPVVEEPQVATPAIAEEPEPSLPEEVVEKEPITEEPVYEPPVHVEEPVVEPISEPAVEEPPVVEDEPVVHEPVVADEPVPEPEEAAPFVEDVPAAVEEEVAPGHIDEPSAPVEEPTPSTVEEEEPIANLPTHGAPDVLPEPTPVIDIPTPAAELVDEPTGTIEPIHEPSPKATDESVDLAPVPVVDAEPVLVDPSTLAPLVDDAETPEPVAASEPEPVPTLDDEELPAAPESVVLSGATPGPAVALSSSEPAAIDQAAESTRTGPPGLEDTVPHKEANGATHAEPHANDDE